MGVILGIDLGEKRVGVAVSDPEGKVALPLTLLAGGDEALLAGEIAALVEEREAVRVVVGLPRSMDGSLGPAAEKVVRFRGVLEERLGVPVETWDERLTSVEAERLLRVDRGRETGKGSRTGRRGGPPPAKREKGAADRIAAVLILQGFLDRRNARPGGERG